MKFVKSPKLKKFLKRQICRRNNHIRPQKVFRRGLYVCAGGLAILEIYIKLTTQHLQVMIHIAGKLNYNIIRHFPNTG